ncbi:MAG: acyl-CoA dehydrogenase family protein [Burkholderiales bacterium]|nr:acyl-CoA dehydrogenase family protein [Burkholderiales bacterium]
MALVLNEEQGMLRDSVKAFLSERAPVAHLRKLRDSRDPVGFDRKLWLQFAEQGYSAVLVPEAHGGLALGAVEASIIAEALGRTLTPTPFLSTAVLAARAIARAGSATQQAELLPAIAAAETVIALAVDETSKHRPGAIAAKATRDGSGWRLDGAKTFVLDGHVAERCIVAARTAEGGLTLLLVDPRAAGVQIERTLMVDAHNAARLRFDGVRIGADALLGEAGAAGAVLDEVLDLGRVVVAAQLLGLADAVFELTLAYLKERRQFERAIGEFQALQHRAAKLYIDIELTRALVLGALQAMDADPAKAGLIVAQAKAHACTTANRAVQEGVQMHGGVGMTDEFDIGLYMKRARTLQELLGDAGFHADRVAAMGGY